MSSGKGAFSVHESGRGEVAIGEEGIRSCRERQSSGRWDSVPDGHVPIVWTSQIALVTAHRNVGQRKHIRWIELSPI